MASPIVPEGFKEELTALVNKHNLDTATNTPDFILAGMLTSALENYQIVKDANERWHGDASPRIRTSRTSTGDCSVNCNHVRAEDCLTPERPAAVVCTCERVQLHGEPRLVANGCAMHGHDITAKDRIGPAWAHLDGPCTEECYRPGHPH